MSLTLQKDLQMWFVDDFIAFHKSIFQHIKQIPTDLNICKTMSQINTTQRNLLHQLRDIGGLGRRAAFKCLHNDLRRGAPLIGLPFPAGLGGTLFLMLLSASRLIDSPRCCFNHRRCFQGN